MSGPGCVTDRTLARARSDWRSCRHQGPLGLEVLGRSVLFLSPLLPALLQCRNVLLSIFSSSKLNLHKIHMLSHWPYTIHDIPICMKSSRAEAPTGRVTVLFCATCPDVLACFGGFVGLWFCFVRAGNAFRSLLLHLAAQVRAPGVGDVASA